MSSSNVHMPQLTTVTINNEVFYKIENVAALRPFFMSIVSDSNHWLFVASNGGISAGRKNAQYALFPYYTDDKITESAELTGSKTIIKVKRANEVVLWEPFSKKCQEQYRTTNNLYQSKWGNSIIFEEINHDLQLQFTYQWCNSNEFGFVKKSILTNLSDNDIDVSVLDGLQNIMPYGVPADVQNSTSNLVDAYKRSELIANAGMGIYALSAIIVDKAEPAEALKANVVWSYGLDNVTYLLSSFQLQHFKNDIPLVQEEDVKGEKGAYFIASDFALAANDGKQWHFVANVNQTQSNVIALAHQINTDASLPQKVANSIEEGTKHLIQLTASADSLQYTADDLKNTRHYNNVLFNIMRGGIFDNNYQIEKWDFELYLKKANIITFEAVQNLLNTLPQEFSVFQLQELAEKSNNAHFKRLATEYLPLKFSRRHGDPSRPWNQFSINTRSEVDGSKILDYQGNWRDIFQNWEALAHAYPAFIEGMITKFLNATTFDGYNPYRVTKDGFDWETIEPDNPWSYIGYWGDHQIIYLQKFLEFAEQYKAGFILSALGNKEYVYANVPYVIKPYEAIVSNPKDTIVYNHDAEKIIHARVKEIGADGALLSSKNGDVYTVNFLEKILATTLAKLSNFIPEAGIWMNTQRPEWNDANNALVGNGVSMVTLYYIRRFLHFLQQQLSKATHSSFEISEELASFLQAIYHTFHQNSSLLTAAITNTKRKEIVDALGIAGSNFRNTIYNNGFSGNTTTITIAEVVNFITVSLQFVDHSIKANKRNDNLYHAYNLIGFTNNEVSIDYLSEMLEGQVAVLSAGCLSAAESVQVLDALKVSSLYRADQNSYILYPNKQLPKFLEKNNIPLTSIQQSALLQLLLQDGNTTIVEKDIHGGYHFNGNFKNADDLAKALQALPNQYDHVLVNDKQNVLNIFESVFNHKQFTGRSGTFFGYEGLGSIYWHMVSKLAVAVQETCLAAINNNEAKEVVAQLINHYYAVSDGIGVHKSPAVYGAFPITPYSHTPLHRGAQQPGMTGQVKEDILTRIGELGVQLQNEKLYFNPTILLKQEFFTTPKQANFYLVDGSMITVDLPPNSLAFTFCQVPIIYILSNNTKIEVVSSDVKVELPDTNVLPENFTRSIINRIGEISLIKVYIAESGLLA
jgi:hypothetical protein